jgi:adenine-specific DNA methylase
MKQGHKLTRRNDQVFCENCGRQWDLDDEDKDITPCKRDSQAGEKAIGEMRKMFCKKPLHGKQ